METTESFINVSFYHSRLYYGLKILKVFFSCCFFTLFSLNMYRYMK